MKITKEDLKKSEVKLTVELTADEFLPYVEKATRRMAEKVQIPGFRKGQAPAEVVINKVGEMAIYEQAAELAVQTTLPKAVEQEKLKTVGQPAIALEKVAPGNPLVYTATLPLMPAVTVGDLKKIKVAREAAVVNDADVEKVVTNVRRMRATEKLVDREAKLGDKVEVSFNVFLDNVPIDGGTSEKYPLVLGEKSMIPGFEEACVGMKKDQEKEFKLDFPKDYGQKQLAGKTCDFKVKMLAVYDVVLPEMNDELAMALGNFKTVADMLQAVRENLQKEKEQGADTKFERDLLEQLINGSAFGDIPEVMLTQETQVMMGEIEQNIARQGLNFDEYLTHLKKTRKQLMLDLTPDAVKRIKSALVIRTLAEERKVVASKEEIDAELHELTHVYESNPDALRQLQTPSYREFLGFVIRNRKTLHWLKETLAPKK